MIAVRSHRLAIDFHAFSLSRVWRVSRWVVICLWLPTMTDDCPAIEAAEHQVLAAPSYSRAVALTPSVFEMVMRRV